MSSARHRGAPAPGLLQNYRLYPAIQLLAALIAAFPPPCCPPCSCDTIFGMSGSAVYDEDFNIRGTHVRGLITYNEFTTLTDAAHALVLKW